MHKQLYSYSYRTDVTFTPEIKEHFFLFRSIPCQNDCQQLFKHRVIISPECQLSNETDSLGNPVQYGSYDLPHNSFSITSVGVVELGQYRYEDSKPNAYYKYKTNLTTCTKEMRQWGNEIVTKASANRFLSSNASDLEKAKLLMDAVYHYLTYTPQVTNVNTTAAQVFEMRVGVCQDYAHLLLALCRTQGLCVRYANGLMLGEGATHAWVEVNDRGFWYGLDPTHNRQIEYDFIKIAHGRDVNDCPSNRGRIYNAKTREETSVNVVVVKLK